MLCASAIVIKFLVCQAERLLGTVAKCKLASERKLGSALSQEPKRSQQVNLRTKRALHSQAIMPHRKKVDVSRLAEAADKYNALVGGNVPGTSPHQVRRP